MSQIPAPLRIGALLILFSIVGIPVITSLKGLNNRQVPTETLKKRLKKCRIKNKDEIDLYGYAEKCRPIKNKLNDRGYSDYFLN